MKLLHTFRVVALGSIGFLERDGLAADVYILVSRITWSTTRGAPQLSTFQQVGTTLYGYLAGSLDFNFLVETEDVPFLDAHKVKLFAEGSTAAKYRIRFFCFSSPEGTNVRLHHGGLWLELQQWPQHVERGNRPMRFFKIKKQTPVGGGWDSVGNKGG